MDFPNPFDEHSAASDDEEALSFCDLVTENDGLLPWENTLRDSNAGPADHIDFDFDFDPGRPTLTLHNSCPADDLFYQGRLLPLSVPRSGSQSDGYYTSRKSYSCEDRRLLLNEKLQAWKTISTDSQSTHWSNPISSRRNFAHKNSRPDNSGNSRSKFTADPPSTKSKTSLKWQFFTLGLMKTPSMKLEDMRLRQAKTSNSGVDNFLKRSVSCNFEEGPKQAVNFQRKSKSAKENLRAEEVQSPRSRGWKMLSPLTSLNACSASTNSVINCSTAKKRGDGGEVSRTPAKKQSLASTYADRDAKNASKLAGSDKSRAAREFYRISFHTTILQVF